MPTKRISVKFRANAEGTLNCFGGGTYPCLGKVGMRYPRDLTVLPTQKWKLKLSQEYGVNGPNGLEPAPMPYAILIWGQRGVYIHSWPGAPTVRGNGNSDTSGCIHLSTIDAPKVYAFVSERTRITISYPW